MLHFGSGAKIDAEYFSEKIQFAHSLRKDLLKTNTNSYRLIFGENDGFPSLIADVYAHVLVIKLYSAIWLPFLETIVTELIKVSKCKTAVLRLSRNIQKHTEALQLKDGSILQGELKDENVHFLE
ncbi:MAG TPA: class I SAM-dependent rRNA methyltransferase, partial [Flavobacteriaceae bacterium]|nr:class I SAM-dependent rRNA methyltransferase [Flavobacteriaceae bacterium]